MSSTVVKVILIVAAIGCVLLFNYLVMRSARRRLESYLQSRGAADIKMSLLLFTGDRDSSTFNVSYTLDGKPHQNRCKVVVGWRGGEIYWKDPL